MKSSDGADGLLFLRKNSDVWEMLLFSQVFYLLQHFFDCPYQFGSESTDSVADAEAFEVQLEAGDTLVMGSDGLFDNMFDRDIEAVVSLFNDTPEAAGTTGEVSVLLGVTMWD